VNVSVTLDTILETLAMVGQMPRHMMAPRDEIEAEAE
jgi:hypothetical protein